MGSLRSQHPGLEGAFWRPGSVGISAVWEPREGEEGAAAGGSSPRRAPLPLREVAGNRDSPSLNPRSGGRAQLVAAGPARSPRNSLPQPDTRALRAAILRTHDDLLGTSASGTAHAQAPWGAGAVQAVGFSLWYPRHFLSAHLSSFGPRAEASVSRLCFSRRNGGGLLAAACQSPRPFVPWQASSLQSHALLLYPESFSFSESQMWIFSFLWLEPGLYRRVETVRSSGCGAAGLRQT